MNEQDIKVACQNVINVVSSLSMREDSLRKELDFLEKRLSTEAQEIPEGAPRRLNHEIMFLCIDTYSAYKGITYDKGSSFYSKVVDNNIEFFRKVQRSNIGIPWILELEEIESDKEAEDASESSESDSKSSLKQFSRKTCLAARRKARDQSFLRFKDSEDRKNSKNQFLEEKGGKSIEQKLSTLRDLYSHRFDCFNKIEAQVRLESASIDCEGLRSNLDVIANAIEILKAFIQLLFRPKGRMLTFNGIHPRYSSLSQLKTFETMQALYSCDRS